MNSLGNLRYSPVCDLESVPGSGTYLRKEACKLVFLIVKIVPYNGWRNLLRSMKGGNTVRDSSGSVSPSSLMSSALGSLYSKRSSCPPIFIFVQSWGATIPIQEFIVTLEYKELQSGTPPSAHLSSPRADSNGTPLSSRALRSLQVSALGLDTLAIAQEYTHRPSPTSCTCFR